MSLLQYHTACTVLTWLARMRNNKQAYIDFTCHFIPAMPDLCYSTVNTIPLAHATGPAILFTCSRHKLWESANNKSILIHTYCALHRVFTYVPIKNKVNKRIYASCCNNKHNKTVQRNLT